MYYDAHTHLNSDQLYPHREQHLEDFQQLGGKALVNIGVNHEWNRRAINIARKSTEYNTKAYATIGLHPGEISFGTITTPAQIDEEIEKIQQVYNENKEYIVGIGECGIDSHFERNNTIQGLQMHAFDLQCQLARQLNLPLIIHSRDNFPLTYEVLKKYPNLKIYFHCRGYSADEVHICHETFPHLRIGFTGNITYPKAHLIRDSFEYIHTISPLLSTNEIKELGVRVLLETDAPYLSPQTKRGQQNVPSHIIDIYTYVSEQWDMPLPDLQIYIQSSFQELYSI